jgi:hypothetical protein
MTVESGGERGGADEGGGERSTRARARGHSCCRLSTSEFTRRIRQSYLRPQTHAFPPSLRLSLSLVRAQIYFD